MHFPHTIFLQYIQQLLLPFFFCSSLLGNCLALLTLKVTEMKRLIFDEISTPFWIFSILIPKYWKRFEGAIGNSLLSRYICVPFGQWRPHQTLFYCKKYWFLVYVCNYLLFVHLYFWSIFTMVYTIIVYLVLRKRTFTLGLLLYTVSVQFSDLYKFEENNVIIVLFSLEHRVSSFPI